MDVGQTVALAGNHVRFAIIHRELHSTCDIHADGIRMTVLSVDAGRSFGQLLAAAHFSFH